MVPLNDQFEALFSIVEEGIFDVTFDFDFQVPMNLRYDFISVIIAIEEYDE